MKIKHKGIRMFKQIRRMMSLAMLMPSFFIGSTRLQTKIHSNIGFHKQ